MLKKFKSHIDHQTTGLKFYIENSLNELKKNFTREYVKITSTKDTLYS